MEKIIPLLIVYRDSNLKSLDKNIASRVINELSGIHTCRFYYFDPIKGKKKIRISIDGCDWGIIVEKGKDSIHFNNPWFRLEKTLENFSDDSAIVEKCYVFFKSDSCSVLTEILRSDYRNIEDALELISSCDKLKKPIVPVHKEEEKEIWVAYCDGLNALNKEKKNLIRIKRVGDPILYNDTRQGEIYTLKLDIEQSISESEPKIRAILGERYQIKEILLNTTGDNLTINLSNVERISIEDLEDLCQYLYQFGFAPTKDCISNNIKFTIALNPLSEQLKVLEEIDEKLELKEVIYETNKDLCYSFNKEEHATIFKDILNTYYENRISYSFEQTIKINHNIDKNLIDEVKSKIVEIQNLKLTNSNFQIKVRTEKEYNEVIDKLEPIINSFSIKIDVPQFVYRISIFEPNDLLLRQLKLDYANGVLKEIKDISSIYEYDREEARVIRVTISFSDEVERENILSKIQSIKYKLGDIYKVSLKNQGFTSVKYCLTESVVQELQDEFNANYNGEEIKLVSGKDYKELFGGILDPDDSTSPSVREQYSRFISNCPTIGICHKRTIDYIIVNLSEEFYNGHDFIRRIYNNDMIFFPSIGASTELKRQYEAIQRINKPGEKLNNGRTISPPVNPKLSDFLFSPLFARSLVENIDSVKKDIKSNCLENYLNDKQIEAVARAILAPDISFIQGPPGTGKTTVIAEIIWQEIRRNPKCKILLTSQTNLAVDNALERLKQKRAIRPLRVISESRIDNDDIIYNVNLLDNWVNKPDEINRENVVNNWINGIISNIENTSQFREVTKEWKEVLQNKDYPVRKQFVELYKDNVNLIASTCSICGSQMFRSVYSKMYKTEDVKFDVVIMDEASKATPLEMAIPMVLGKKIILIGDHKQLPPMLDDNSIDSALNKIGRSDLANRIQSLKESQFKKLFQMAQKYKDSLVTTLDTQFRMHKDIMMTVNQFYVDELGPAGLKCGIEDVMNTPDFKIKGSRWHGISNEPFISPNTHAIWVNVRGKEEKEKNSSSYKNTKEVDAVKTVIKALTKSAGFEDYINAQTKLEDKEIGIITFYSAQRRALKEVERSGGFSRYYDYRIEVVDRFQGVERNIIIVSTVRSNRYHSIGFAKEIERINVAFSRARTLLIVVGDKDLFASKESYNISIKHMETIDIKQIEDLVRNER